MHMHTHMHACMHMHDSYIICLACEVLHTAEQDQRNRGAVGFDGRLDVLDIVQEAAVARRHLHKRVLGIEAVELDL